MTTIFYLFSNVFHIYATYQFSNVFLQKKKESAKSDIVLFTLYYIINSCAYLAFDNRLITILSNIIPFILIFLYYKVSLFKSFLSAFVLCVFSIVVDTAVVAIQSLLNINSVFFDEGFVSNIVLLTLVNIIAKSYFKYSDQIVKLPIMYYITVIFVPLGSIMVGYFVAKDLNVVSLILSVIILLMNIVILYLYDNLVNMFSQQYETDVIEQQNKAYLNQLHLMQESQMKIRFLKHDMKNHIINMQSLLSAEKYDQLKDYLAETNDYIYSNNVIIDSGNETIDSVLNYKLAPLENNSVEKSYHVVLPEQILISSFDLNIVICNLIDNALEALSLLGENDEKKITIDIVYKQGYIKILVGNSFDGIIHKDKRTRKNDEINHGIGLKSVQNIAEKYGVNIVFRPFIKVEGLTSKEFRQQKISIPEYTAVIFTARTAIDHFFRLCEELRVTIPETMKYFCTTEAIALYLQKYIIYRKRKIFFGNSGKLDDLVPSLLKHSGEKFLFPVSDVHKEQTSVLEKHKINYTKAIMYRTVSNDFGPDEPFDYDMLLFFSPSGIKSLTKNFPDFKQDDIKIGTFGPTTAQAVRDAGLRLDIEAPSPGAPSMTAALDLFLKEQSKKK